MNDLILAVFIFTAVTLGITALILTIARKLKKDPSPYLVFGIVVILCGLLVSGIAVYDILTPGGDLNGMLGQILLMTFIPAVIVLLTADIILWVKAVKKKNR